MRKKEMNRTITTGWRDRSKRLLTIISLLVLWVITTNGQAPSPTATPAPTASPNQSASPGPTPIPMPEVVAQAEAATARLQDLAAEIAADQTINTVEKRLPTLAREVDARLADTTKILAARPSLDTLRTLEADWRSLTENLPAWRRELTARATKIEAEIAELAALSSIWEQTFALAQSSSAPPELAARAETVLAAIKQTRAQLEDGRTRILTLQSRVSEEETRTNAALVTVKEMREKMVGRLFVNDSPPIWSASIRTRSGSELWHETRQSIITQFTALREYATRQADNFWLHGLLLLVLAGVLYWARRKVRPWVEAEPTLKPAATVFELPIAAALLLSVFLSSWLYPQAPRLLTALMGAAALAPTIIILRRMITRPLYPVLNALVVFYFADRLRDVAQALPLMSRLLFLAEMLGGLIFLGWLAQSSRLASVDETERDGLWRSIRLGARLGLPVFALAFARECAGLYQSGATDWQCGAGQRLRRRHILCGPAHSGWTGDVRPARPPFHPARHG